MSGLIEVVWCPNPLRPVADRQVRRLLATGTDTVDSLVKRLGLAGTPLVAVLNALPVRRRRWGRRRVRPGDTLVLAQRARGVEAATVAAKTGWSMLASTVAAFAINVAISYALTTIAASLRSKPGSNASGADGSGPNAYGVEGGANQARPYAPLPLVLGEHRMFPDYASRPFSEYVVDPSTAYDVINTTPVYEVKTAPAFSVTDSVPLAPWTELSSDAVYRYFGDNAPRTYLTKASGTVASVTQPHTFVVRYPLPDLGGTSGVTTWEDYYVAPPPQSGGNGDGTGGDDGFGGTAGSGNDGGDNGAGTGE